MREADMFATWRHLRLGLAYSWMAGRFTVLYWHENGEKKRTTGAVRREMQLSMDIKESDTVMVRQTKTC